MNIERSTGMQPSQEARPKHLEMARAQGEAYERALRTMVQEEAHGDEAHAGDYVVAYAVEKAEGLWIREGDRLEWREPREENCHVEVSVRDAADGRFLPHLDVEATLVDHRGTVVGTHRQPFLWHPWLFHYGRNWKVPGDGAYTLRVRIAPPSFARHDPVNGKRFAEPAEVEFTGVEITTGQKRAR